MDFLYNKIFIQLVKLYIKFQKNNKKLKNREIIANNLLNNFGIIDNSISKKKIWFHVASMGEFEQARPIIEKIKLTQPNIYIILTFFSPSGYENLKNYEYADLITYLPLDYKENAIKFIENINPNIAIFIRYEIWFNYLNELHNKEIPIFLLNASQPQNKFINFYYKRCFSFFKKIYVMNKLDLPYFIDMCGIKKIKFLPDTRFDRIFGKVNESIQNPFLDKTIFGKSKVLVAGSTWEEDEDLLLEAVKKINAKNDIVKLSLIIVPHEPTREHLDKLTQKLNKYTFLSNINSINENEKIEIQLGDRIIIVDSIGNLLKLYANADIAYIGGAFGDGVHSVTEPAGYGIPLITGKDIRKSPDAKELKSIGALFTIENSIELFRIIDKLLNDNNFYSNVSQISSKFVNDRLGSTDIFIKDIEL